MNSYLKIILKSSSYKIRFKKPTYINTYIRYSNHEKENTNSHNFTHTQTHDIHNTRTQKILEGKVL